MQKSNLVDLISKLTIHMDKDLSSTAVETLKNMIRELPRWRLNVVGGACLSHNINISFCSFQGYQ